MGGEGGSDGRFTWQRSGGRPCLKSAAWLRFLSRSVEYEPQIYSLLFGEVLGVSTTERAPVAAVGIVCIAAVTALYRPLMLSSIVPEIGEAKGVRSHRMEICFLIVVALATAMTVPVVGALLIFSLMIGPPRPRDSSPADRCLPWFCRRPSSRGAQPVLATDGT